MMGLPEAEWERVRDLARSVAAHRRAGGELDGLPVPQQVAVQGMGEAERQVFLEELARADAAHGRAGFHAALGRWRASRPGEPDPEGVP